MGEQPETQKESPLATVAFGRTGIQLHTFDDLWRFAAMAVKSKFAPKDMTIEDAVCAIQLGSEVGLSAMSALQRIAVINGRPSVWGDALLGICQRSGRFDHGVFRESFEGKPYEDDYTAVCFVKRIGSEAGVLSEYSVADAKKANLWGKSGTWTTNPKRMLKYRARAFALRDAFADVVTGLYDRDEMLDADIIEPRTVRSRDVTDEQITDSLRKKPAPPTTQSEAAMAVQAPVPPQSVPTAPEPPEPPPAPENAVAPAPASPTDAEGPIGKASDLYGTIKAAFDRLPDAQRVKLRTDLRIVSIATVATYNQVAANDVLDTIEAKLAPAT